MQNGREKNIIADKLEFDYFIEKNLSIMNKHCIEIVTKENPLCAEILLKVKHLQALLD